jgi:hypothetical protein
MQVSFAVARSCHHSNSVKLFKHRDTSPVVHGALIGHLEHAEDQYVSSVMACSTAAKRLMAR